MEPVTGRHSVILKLLVGGVSLPDRRDEEKSSPRGCTYPDSVRRVRPPKMTIPKTLAALPSSQYATDLEFSSGNDELLASSLTLLARSAASSRVGAAVLLALLVVFKHRTEKEAGARNSRSVRVRWRGDSSVDEAFDCPFDLRHWRHTKEVVEVEVENAAGDDSRDSCWASLRMPTLPMLGGAGWKKDMAMKNYTKCLAITYAQDKQRRR